MHPPRRRPGLLTAAELHCAGPALRRARHRRGDGGARPRAADGTAAAPGRAQGGHAQPQHPEIARVEVEGHTDSTATKQHNQRLSEQRAAAVKAYLVDKGIAADRLTTRGYGEDRPVGDNGTEEGRFKNRRVEFKILLRR